MFAKGLRGAGLLAAISLAAAGMSVVNLAHAHAAGRPVSEPRVATPTPAPVAIPSPSPPPVVLAPQRSFAALDSTVSALEAASGAHIAVALVELGGTDPQSWSYAGDDSFTAASTYKLPLLMAEAEGIAAGTFGRDDQLCYESSDYEDGWFDDYAEGACFSRETLAERAGLQSDNTAAHILVRYLGGGDALNAYARAHGARQSDFWDPNTTTAADLGRLLVDEAAGHAGGVAAQAILYSWLTNTEYEAGIPAGIPPGIAVAHKVGAVDSTLADAALVPGPQGAYALVVINDGVGGAEGWNLIAAISAQVWRLEAGRSA